MSLKKTGRRKAIKAFEQSYRSAGKIKSGEYAREKREFYYDRKNKEVSLLPTDDADRIITKGVKKRNLGENFKSPLNSNAKDWTPSGPTTPEQKAQYPTRHNPQGAGSRDSYGVKKFKATPQSERNKLNIPKDIDYDPSGMQQMYKNTGRISMVGHPGEYIMGGGAVGGFKTAKTLLGKAFEKGSKYVVKSAKRSAKPSSIGSNTL